MACDMFRFLGSSWGGLDEGTIDAPVLIYNGELDTTCPPTMLEFFSRIYPQTQTTVLPGHGHCTMFLELERIIQELTTCTTRAVELKLKHPGGTPLLDTRRPATDLFRHAQTSYR